jgi:pectate lyase
VTVKWTSDGFTAVNTGGQGITFSWLHFDGVNDSDCDDAHTLAADVAEASTTFHHSFFDHVETHSPSVHGSSARVHLFDNLMSDNVSYAVESACCSRATPSSAWRRPPSARPAQTTPGSA